MSARRTLRPGKVGVHELGTAIARSSRQARNAVQMRRRFIRLHRIAHRVVVAQAIEVLAWGGDDPATIAAVLGVSRRGVRRALAGDDTVALSDIDTEVVRAYVAIAWTRVARMPTVVPR
jgi:hypothetical protein